METKINIAEILKDKPQGTKLYDWLYNIDVELDTISTTDTETVVWCTNKTDNNTTYHRGYSEFGTVRGCPDSLQILLPSKEMRDWSKFAWKKGDVLVSKDNVHIIFEKFEDDAYTRFKGKHYLWKECDEEDYSKEETKMLTSVFEKANDDAAQTYIKTIEERLGGKLNLETLEVEKHQTEFKDGDIVVYGESVAICRKIYKDTLYFYVSINDVFGLLFNEHVVSSEGYRFATDEDKQRLFDALAKENKAWDVEKKQIVDLKPKCEFKPFDRCIWKIRNCEGSIWQASFVSYVDEYGATPMGMPIDEDLVNLIILPYNEETAKMIGTTKDVEK